MTIERVVSVFDSKNLNWSRTYGHNRMFLQAQQKYANVMLADRGFLALNDVLELLGIEQTEQGAISGWVEDGMIQIDFGEEADVPPIDKPSITLQFNINSTNVFHDKK